MSDKKQCQCLTKNGKGSQCKRSCQKGSNFCYQHAGTKVEIKQVDTNPDYIDLVEGISLKAECITDEDDIFLWSLGETINWETIETPDQTILEGQGSFTINVIADITENGDILHERLVFEGPVSLRQCIDRINEFYHTHPMSIEALQEQTNPVGLKKTRPYVYDFDVE